MPKFLLLIFIALVLTGCGTCKRPIKPREAYFQKTTFATLKGWQNENHYEAVQVFLRSCNTMMKQRDTSPVSKRTSIGGRIGQWRKACNAASGIWGEKQAKQFWETHFIPYKILKDKSGNPKGLFTGYYEIELEGSLKKHGPYQHPVHAKPAKLHCVKGTEKISRSAIINGALNGKQLELVWVNSLARLYFMHIQGSGVIKLSKGGEMKLGYDDSNGFSYNSIYPRLQKSTGNQLIFSPGETMYWLDSNPQTAKQILATDKSYVFFKRNYNESPIGAQGVPLTPERSIAIDSDLFPYGLPFWVEIPSLKNQSLYHRIMVAQDRGGAIKGAVRADIFWGRGYTAEKTAFSTKHPGGYYALFPKGVVVPAKYVSH